MISLKDKIAAKLAANRQGKIEQPTGNNQANKTINIKLPSKISLPLSAPKAVNTNQSHSYSDSQLAETSQDLNLINNNSDIGFILNNIESLRIAIHEVHPTMPQLLQTIWKQLKDNPDCVTILKPEQIAVIVQGAEIQTNIKISEGISKPRASKKKVLTVDDV